MLLAILSTVVSFIGVYYLYFLVLQSESKLTFDKYFFDKDFKLNLIRIFGSVLGSLFISYLLVQIFASENTATVKVCFAFAAIFLVLFFIYISLFDFEYFEIPFLYTILVVAVIIVLSIIFAILNGFSTNIIFWGSFILNPVEILFGGIIAGGIVGLIVLLSRERAMGMGDIPISALMGLILGSKYLIAGFYITILSALVFGLLNAVIVKRFKGLKIPFVPFICLGIIGGIIFGEAIMKYLFLVS